MLSGLFSGLTLGLLSLSPFELKRKADLGDDKAAKVYPIRKKGNELLVALLVGNVLVNSALTVLLSSVQSGLIAVIFSTILITIFGEITPQAALRKHGLDFGARLSPFIKWFLLIASPISVPIAKLLDRTLGGETPDIYSKDELVKIVEEHEKSRHSDVDDDELRLVENALNFGEKSVKDVMTPKKMIHFIDSEERVGSELIAKLYKSGLSRFPVVVDKDLDKVIGMLYLRDVIMSNKNSYARSIDSDKVLYIDEDTLLDDALDEFIRTKRHLFIVANNQKETVGVLSMEDILEEIIGQEIVDEFDVYDDMQKEASRQKTRITD